MSIIMNVQFTVFSNNRIEPTPDNIGIILNKLNSLGKYTFLPSMINGQNIDLAAGKMDPVSNISFVTLDQHVQIACMNERIDIVINGTQNNQSVPIEEHLEFARTVLDFLMEKYHTYSNRLAINISLLSGLIQKSIRETAIGKRMCSTFDYYQGKELDEWSSRVNTKQAIQMAREELLNVITDISVVTDNKSSKKRFMTHMDINTVFENNGYRFAANDLGPFIENVIGIVNNIKNNFEELDDE